MKTKQEYTINKTLPAVETINGSPQASGEEDEELTF